MRWPMAGPILEKPARRLGCWVGGTAPLPSFEAGGNREYGLAAVDINNDGIYDLLVGATTSQEIPTPTM